jgi:hypothetical protein
MRPIDGNEAGSAQLAPVRIESTGVPMRASLSLRPEAHADNDWSCYLPGFTLTHTLHLVSNSDPSVIAKAADVLKSENIDVDRWSVVRSGDLFDQSIQLAGITETRAGLLREQLASLDGMLRTRLEHHFSSERSANRSC